MFSKNVRPRLDYCLSAVGPYMVQDFRALEKVQRRATKLVRGIKHLSYQERLAVLQIPSMEERLQRGELIETFKILTGKVVIDPGRFFERNQDTRTRGPQLKPKKQSSGSQLRAQFFSNRVITGAFHDRSTTPDALIFPILIKFGERGYLQCQKHWSQS